VMCYQTSRPTPNCWLSGKQVGLGLTPVTQPLSLCPNPLQNREIVLSRNDLYQLV